jgi:hypothetical protein
VAYPPLPWLTIASPLLPWAITVLPSSSSSPHRSNYVTVSNVLVTLYHTLSLPATRDEYHSLPSEEATSLVNASFDRRVRAIADRLRQEEEWREGVKKIDFLLGCHRFLGLSRMGWDPTTFVLNVR